MCQIRAKHIRILTGLLLCVFLGAIGLSFGQMTTSTISGVVKDQSGAVIPGVTVSVRNLETNATRVVATDEAGRYLIPGLSVGPYELTVALSGFTTYKRSPISVVLNQAAVVDVELRPAGTAWFCVEVMRVPTTISSSTWR